MRIGIATDHGGFGLKEELLAHLRDAGCRGRRFRGAQPGPERRLSGYFGHPAGAGRGGRERWSAVWRSAAAASAPRRWTPSSRPTPATPARRWPWRRSPTPVAALPALRPPGPHLAQPRPLRPLGGHASMLLYSLLHLTGVKAVTQDYEALGEPSVPLDDIKQFRQLDSRCPGHPEYRWTSGRRDDHRPARPGRGQPASAWPSPAGGWPPTSTAPASSCSTTTSTPCAATAA